MPSPRQCHIALVDDEQDLRNAVSAALREDGFEVSTYSDGADAWEAFADSLPDIAVLDILMPRMDGLELCRRLRGLSRQLPILFLSSKDDEWDRVIGLELGADDYLGKPFSMRELVARVRVLHRRLELYRSPETNTAEETLQVGPLELDIARHQATHDGEPFTLTITEFRLLRALGERPGHVRTRAQLIEQGYPDDTYVSERTIDTHIKRLRKKLFDLSPQLDLIETVYGLGYKLRDG